MEQQIVRMAEVDQLAKVACEGLESRISGLHEDLGVVACGP
jgi:hypothetical protein